MSLLAVKRKFIISLTILMVVLSWGGALVIMSVYAVAVAHQVLSFIGTYMVFYIIFLIFETRFFFHFEIKHKSNRYKYK